MSTRIGLRLGWGSGLSSARVFDASVTLGALVLLGSAFVASRGLLLEEPTGLVAILFWTATIALVEFFQVPAWKSLSLSIGFPLLTAVAFLFPPPVAGMVCFLGSSDPREVKGEVRPLRALFNRSQIALSFFAGSWVFHSLGGDAASWSAALPGLPAVVTSYVVNVVFAIASLSFDAGRSLRDIASIRNFARKLRIGNPLEFVVSYLGLGFLGVVLARLFLDVGAWSVAAFVLPLLLVRQMFFRTRALEDAAKELQDREVVLRTLSNRMAEERQDERVQIAGYLHDDLAQMLYRMSLHIDISEKQLASGAPDGVRAELEKIRDAKDRTLKLVRSLIKDLHRSPLGRAGLADAISSFTADLERDGELTFVRDLRDVDMPPPIQLLCYQVAREAVMNVVKHAEASTVHVTLEPTEEGARLTVLDDGKGFDPEAGSPEGHYGLTMMRERAQISGGALRVRSAPGEGSTVVAEFRTAWLSDPEAGEGGVGAPPGPA